MQNSLTTARITPIADSATALTITKADGSTAVAALDTSSTNAFTLSGNVRISYPYGATHITGTSLYGVNFYGPRGDTDGTAMPYASIKTVVQYADGADTINPSLAFFTSNRSWEGDLSEKMRITHGGAVGIGTSSPTSKLTINTPTFTGAYGCYANERASLLVSGNDSYHAIMISSNYNNATIPNYGLVLVNGASASDYDVWGIMHDGPANATGGLRIGYMHGTASGTNIHTGYTAHVSINKTGYVGIGCTPSYQLELSTNSAGKPTSEHWTVTSDARLKQDISDISNALTTLLSLRGRSYQWIPSERSAQGEGTRIGFIAQEVETVFPQWVGENNKGTKHLTIAGLDALVVEAIRELKNRVEILEAKE